MVLESESHGQRATLSRLEEGLVGFFGRGLQLEGILNGAGLERSWKPWVFCRKTMGKQEETIGKDGKLWQNHGKLMGNYRICMGKQRETKG